MNVSMRDASTDFAHYLQSIVRLGELQKLTDNLDQELEDSKRTMLMIKSMFDTLPTVATVTVQEQINMAQRDEITNQLLEAAPPNGLLPDMINSNELDDLDVIITSLKVRAEKFKSEYERIAQQINGITSTCSFDDLALDQYAASLNQLNKQMMNIKLTKKDVINRRSQSLEEKLTQLFQEVNLFTQMIQAHTALNDSNKNWSIMQESTTITQYESMISKLLSGINEASYLLKNKN